MPVTLQSAPMLPSLGDKMQRKRAARAACGIPDQHITRTDSSSAISVDDSAMQFRTSRPAYIAHLEKKVQALQDQLRRSSCGSEQSNDIDEAFTAHTPPNFINRDRPASGSRQGQSTATDSHSLSHNSIPRPGSIRRTDTLASCDDTVDYIETITTEPRGKPFGFDILRQLINFVNHMATPPTLHQDSSLKIVQALDSSQSIDDMVASSTSNPLLPPSLDDASRLVEIAFSEAFQLWPFVDKSQIERTIYRLYNTNTFGQDFGDKEELGLVYAILALGQRFDSSVPLIAGARRAQGAAYFTAAQNLVPLTHCDRNLCAIQTVLCLALFLKAASAPGRVHSYLAAAASAALRLGLHEDIPGFPKDESALRRRVWSAVNAFDIYISVALGVPRTVAQENDCEQDFYPILSAIGANTELVASDSYMEMLCILGRGIANVHNSATARRPVGLGAYSVSQQGIQEASAELEEWAQNSPVLLQAAEHMTRSQLHLMYTYDYAQLLLHLPFVHYLIMPGIDTTSQPYILGRKAVRAAVHAIQIAELLHKQLRFNEAYFLTIDILAYAATTLTVIELGDNNNKLDHEALQASRTAKELLLVLSLHSETAAHCWEALAVRSSPQTSPTGMQTSLRRSKAPGKIQMPPNPNYRPATLQPTDSAIDVSFSSLQFSQTQTGGMVYNASFPT